MRNPLPNPCDEHKECESPVSGDSRSISAGQRGVLSMQRKLWLDNDSGDSRNIGSPQTRADATKRRVAEQIHPRSVPILVGFSEPGSYTTKYIPRHTVENREVVVTEVVCILKATGIIMAIEEIIDIQSQFDILDVSIADRYGVLET